MKKSIKKQVFMIILVLGLSVCLLPVNLAAYAFYNGQNANIVIGQADFTHHLGNQGGSVSTNTLFTPYGMSFDSSGNLWVADIANNRILEFTTPFSTDESASLVIGQADFTHGSANQGGSVSTNTLFTPYGMSFDSSGNLWVTDAGNNRVLEFTTPFSTDESASLVIGQADFTHGSANQGGSVSTNTLYSPHSITFDSPGNLWVADQSNNRLLEFTIPFSTDQAASTVIGQADFTHGSANQGGSVSTNTLNIPQSVKFDLSGNLWVADFDNNRILKFTTPFSTDQAASTVIGQADFTHGSANQGGSVSANTLRAPNGVSFDSSGNLWVADAANARVLKFTTPFSTDQAASTVIGQADFTSNVSTVTQNGIAIISDAIFDSFGHLWVGDMDNNRLLEFLDLPAPSVPEFPLGGLVFLFVGAGVAYALIRYRIFNPTNLRIHL